MLQESQSPERRWFLKIGRTLDTVICCRVSPSQKASVVKLMREDDPEIISLAIGDGANDVPMILQADIGIGLFGKEGLRAVDSSDYAIAEFKFLRHLIFKHGRHNYDRMTMLVQYYFYKNFAYTMTQTFFSFVNGVSMQTVFPDLFLTAFNLFFTAGPIFVYATREVDVNPAIDGDHIGELIP